MRAGIVFGLMLVATPTWGQPPPSSAGAPQRATEITDRLQRVQAMERALEEAVARGVRVIEGQLPAVPGLVFFAGQIRVRGFDLEDYGVFFDVEYPVVRRSMLWSMNMLQFDGGMSRVLNDLRRRLQAMPEGPGQAAFEQTIAELEAELQRSAPVRAAADAGRERRVSEDRRVVDPAEAYLSALTSELTGAMVAQGRMLLIPSDHWLSVAARDGRGRIDPRVNGRSTILKLRIRGRDLASLREGRLSADEARRRVEAPSGDTAP